MKVIYLVRHGDVEDKYKKRFRGILDCDLSPDGIRMSQANAQFLAAQKIDWVVTSGRKRADFVGMLLARNGISHHVDPRFCEADFGAWEGKNWGEVEHQYPAEFKQYHDDFYELTFPGGESIRQMQARVKQAWDDWVIRDFNKIAIVGHSTTNTALLALLKGISFREQEFQVIGSYHEVHWDYGNIFVAGENKVVYES